MPRLTNKQFQKQPVLKPLACKQSLPAISPMPVWYHKPSDEYRPDWDLAGTVANVQLLTSVALSLANTD